MIHRVVLNLMLLVSLGMLAMAQEKSTQPASTNPQSEPKKESKMNPVVVMKTSMGTIKIELFEDKAPVTVKNFLSYVDEKFFDNTVFHRVIKKFMNQGGGFDASDPIKQKKTKAPIINESTNGLKNDRGTICMARTQDPNSATSQFFINVVDNTSLNRTEGNPGYAVFGKVTEGMDIVDKINSAPTGNAPAIAMNGEQPVQTTFQDVPVTKIVVESVRRAGGKK